MIDNGEIIVKKHDLKLKIQKAIVKNKSLIKDTYDIGRTTWDIAEEVLKEIMLEKQTSKRNINSFVKKVVDISKTEL